TCSGSAAGTPLQVERRNFRQIAVRKPRSRTCSGGFTRTTSIPCAPALATDHQAPQSALGNAILAHAKIGNCCTACQVSTLEMPIAGGLYRDRLPRLVDHAYACSSVDPTDHGDRHAELCRQGGDRLGGIAGGAE